MVSNFFFFTPIPGDMIQFDDCAYFSFMGGKFNHQLVLNFLACFCFLINFLYAQVLSATSVILGGGLVDPRGPSLGGDPFGQLGSQGSFIPNIPSSKG